MWGLTAFCDRVLWHVKSAYSSHVRGQLRLDAGHQLSPMLLLTVVGACGVRNDVYHRYRSFVCKLHSEDSGADMTSWERARGSEPELVLTTWRESRTSERGYYFACKHFLIAFCCPSAPISKHISKGMLPPPFASLFVDDAKNLLLFLIMNN